MDEKGLPNIYTEYNLVLGEKRALAVKQYLMAVGVVPTSIEAKSYGEERPVATGSNEESWKQNRRAEVKITQF